MNDKAAQKAYLLGAVFVFLGAVFVSTKAIFVKLAYAYGIESTSLLTLRMLFSLPFFISILVWFNVKNDKKAEPLTIVDWLRIGILGLLGYYIASWCDFFGLEYITASFERIVLYLYPTIVLLISFFLLKQKITKAHIGALVLTYIGVGMAFWENLQSDTSKDVLIGTSLVFLSALSYSVYLVGSGLILKKVGTIRFNSGAMIAAAIGIFSHHLLWNDAKLWSFPVPVYQLSLLIAIFATVVPTFLIVEGVRKIGANNAAIITSIGPISTIVLAYIFLNERLGWLQWTGTLFVIGGVLLITLRKRS